MIKDSRYYKRYDAKHGKVPPPGFLPAQEPDKLTGHWPGWILVNHTGKEDMYHMEGLKNSIMSYGTLADGTYELIGPKINGNKEKRNFHILIKHGCMTVLNEFQLNFEGIKQCLIDLGQEGIVWHHPDGRMVKIRMKDYGLQRI